MTVEDTKHLHRIPQTFFVEVSHVHVYVGTGGDHQDEFTRADHPKRLFRNSIAPPSLLAGILNAKYGNSMPLERISKQFSYDDLRLSKQTMSNWIIRAEEKYLRFLYDRLLQELMKYHVQQCDETPVTVKNDIGAIYAARRGHQIISRIRIMPDCPSIINSEYTLYSSRSRFSGFSHLSP